METSDVRPIVAGHRYLILDKLIHPDGLVRFRVRDEAGDEYWVISPGDAMVNRDEVRSGATEQSAGRVECPAPLSP